MKRKEKKQKENVNEVYDSRDDTVKGGYQEAEEVVALPLEMRLSCFGFHCLTCRQRKAADWVER